MNFIFVIKSISFSPGIDEHGDGKVFEVVGVLAGRVLEQNVKPFLFSDYEN